MVDKEIGNALLEKMAKEGAEFSRPLQTTARVHSHFLSQRFQIEIEELQLFPEQIEGERFF